MISPINSWVVSCLLAVGLVFMAFGWNGTHNTLIKERAQHELVVQQFKASQKEANEKAEAKRVELERKATQDAQQADSRYNDLLAQYRSSLLRYQANQSSGSGSSGSSSEATQSSPGPSSNTRISITLKDAEICAINTARLQAVNEWAHTVK